MQVSVIIEKKEISLFSVCRGLDSAQATQPDQARLGQSCDLEFSKLMSFVFLVRRGDVMSTGEISTEMLALRTIVLLY